MAFSALTLVSPAQQQHSPKPLDPLSPAELRNAKLLVRSAPEVKRALGEENFTICSVDFVSPKVPLSGTGESTRKARVIAYNRDTNRAIAATVDLTGNRLVDIQPIDSQDVPLAPEEAREAKTIALEDGRVQALVKRKPAEFKIDAILLQSSEQTDPCNADRCVALSFQRGGEYIAGTSVIVNLSKKTVSVQSATH